MNCKICGASTSSLSHALVLGKFPVEYFHCGNCSFVQTESPFWLADAYSEAVADSDVGLVGRNIALSRLTHAIIATLFNPGAQFLDWGGGYGLFVRLMRDEGFDFFRYDKYCQNLFARGLDADLVGGIQHFELITAFEVLEHLENPVVELNNMLSVSPAILFSTLLVPDSPPPFDKWWYYSLETGQHIAFFSLKTLQHIAREFGMNLHSNGHNLHMLSVKQFPNLMFKALSKQKVAGLIRLFTRRRSVTSEDYKRLTSKRTEL